jgi:hypothetical protein
LVVLNSFGNPVKVPLLGGNILPPSLQPNVVCAMAFSDSFHWKSRSNVEGSVDMETKLFIESLGAIFGSLINVSDSPFLTDRSVSASYIGLDAFLSLAVLNCLACLEVGELLVFVCKLSPPLSLYGVDVNATGDHVFVLAISVLLQKLVAVHNNSFCFAVELPSLTFVSIFHLGQCFS